MNLEELYTLQEKLDKEIAKNLGMENEFNNVEVIDNRIFALKVEVGELANEVGFFKYWKQSHAMDRDKTLEEHADCVHFILSIGNSRNYNKFIKQLRPEKWDKVPLSMLFHYIMNNPYNSSGEWLNAFEQLICIGLKLGFTESDIVQSYRDKNIVNYQRIVEKY
jgi:dimeric dUTPase (all-alpha-NTP-PPase superfamily)